LGIRLIKKTVEHAKGKGADMMAWNSPLSSPLRKILERLDYAPLEVVLVKEI
jgi:hypothetical protein